MDFTYETERLILRISEPGLTEEVLDFVLRNREDFEKWDRTLPEAYYTADYQEKVLMAEMRLLLRASGVRFYLFLRDNPDYVIGTASFAYLSEENGHRCSLGYKMDREYRRQGYAFEAISFLMPVVAGQYHLHRIEADILAENEASLALIRKLGFEFEGIARNAHEIAGVERDHMRFSYCF